MKDFNGKAAFITGAAHGFGKAIATKAASLGMKLTLVDQDKEALSKVADELSKSTEVLKIVADITEEKNVDNAVDKAMKKYNEIDLLVNDAGVAVPGPIWKLPTRDWEWILHADLMSQVYALKKVIPIMMKQAAAMLPKIMITMTPFNRHQLRKQLRQGSHQACPTAIRTAVFQPTR